MTFTTCAASSDRSADARSQPSSSSNRQRPGTGLFRVPAVAAFVEQRPVTNRPICCVCALSSQEDTMITSAECKRYSDDCHAVGTDPEASVAEKHSAPGCTTRGEHAMAQPSNPVSEKPGVTFQVASGKFGRTCVARRTAELCEPWVPKSPQKSAIVF
jgi:hypothetical protein